jgi:predicted RNA-binding protein with PIN domain
LAFLNYLASSFTKRQRSTTTIVFDAAGAPPGLPQTIYHDGMTVHFARRQSNADEMIEELLEDWRAPKSLTVVSSDHRVQRAARSRGAAFVDSEVWYADLQTSRRASEAKQNDASLKPTGTLSPGEVAHWLAAFGDAPDGPQTGFKTPAAEDKLDGIFPPGYGDDLEE